ncbi:MAG: UDP-N-acetylmuramoyl-L-alanyl-D-glutamate--2,6-diaminopimelate ligase [bacterium]|jgi:UDP-N-acetylmuramoyl-L-alanyl-D-glutamate--2,6-diaminopimelate ligase
MLLSELIKTVPILGVRGSTDQEITHLTADSRAVQPGTLFVCIHGEKHDGHSFIPQAIRNGAAAIIGAEDLAPSVTYIRTEDTRLAAGRLAAAFHGYPSRRLRVVGVTGTSGKTTTTYLTDAILERAGNRVGLIGTIRNKVGGKDFPVEHTTPESIDLQSLCGAMVAAGDNYLVMEVSSHALELHRVEGLEFDVAVFTNLSHEHLDFHGTMADYLAAKAKLFRRLPTAAAGTPPKQPKTAVINSDDPHGGEIIKQTEVPVLTYGIESAADIKAENVRVTAAGVRYMARTPLGAMELHLPVTGLFNVYNSLAAIGAAVAEGISPAVIKAALEEFGGVPGRFELVAGGQDFAVIVDYAHKPDGLEKVLRTARGFARGRIITVFGCGGDRDRTKRPLMGEIAGKLADYTVITSDNPRSEDPLAIIREVESGIARVTDNYTAEADRQKAIERAIRMAKRDDIVIIAGKGHETSQVLKEGSIHFDDREVARNVLRRLEK